MVVWVISFVLLNFHGYIWIHDRLFAELIIQRRRTTRDWLEANSKTFMQIYDSIKRHKRVFHKKQYLRIDSNYELHVTRKYI